MEAIDFAGGFERYNSAVTNVVLQAAEEAAQVFDEPLRETIINLLSEKGPTVVERTLSPRERFFGKVVYGFREISNTVDTLRDIALYIRRSPYPQNQVSRVRYLRYHVENHLNELYILSQRLESYTKVIARAYKKSKNGPYAEHICSILDDMVHKSFLDLKNTRGTHVHESRYEHRDFDKLGFLENLATADLDENSLVEGHSVQVGNTG